jgi:EmrB/QacA subfamily drug resistance transporter
MNRKWWTLAAVCFGIFMLLLDITVVNVALPAIQGDLHSSFADLQWVIDAYTLTLAAFLLTAGVIGDMAGRRKLYALGLCLFTISSLVCGLSSTSLMLDLARAAQGVGGAIMFATSLALLAQAFTGKERGAAFGIYGAVVGGAVAVGPLLGGAITGSVGWRWIFFLNLPIGVVAVLITLAKVDDSRDPVSRRVDWIGFVTFSGSLFLLVFALVQGNAKGWRSHTIIGMLAGAAVLMVAFLVAEAVQRQPMLELGLFKRPAMVGVSVTAFAISASIFAMFLYLTLYLQEVLGYGAFQAGLRFLPITVLAFVVAPLSGRLSVVVQSRYLLGLGMLCIAVGCALTTHVRPDSTWTVLLPGFLLAGLGIGIANPVLASASVAVVPPERSGMASGSSNTFRQVGIATGIAALGAVFLAQIRPNTVRALSAPPTGRVLLAHGGTRLSAVIAGGDVRAAVLATPAGIARTTLADAYRTGFTTTFNHLMWIALVVSLVGAASAFLLVRQRDFVPSGDPMGAPGTVEVTGPAEPASVPAAPVMGGTAAPGAALVPTAIRPEGARRRSTPPWRPARHSRRRSSGRDTTKAVRQR